MLIKLWILCKTIDRLIQLDSTDQSIEQKITQFDYEAFQKFKNNEKCSKNMTWLKYIILLKLFKTIFCLIFTYTVLFKKKSI
jgi:hypothetical protein